MVVDEELALKAAGDDGKEWDLFRPQDFEWGNIFGPEEESMSDVSGSEASTADETSLAAFRGVESSTWSFRLSDFLPQSTKLKLDKNAAANARVRQTGFSINERVHVYALQGLAMESLNHVLQFAGEEPENNLHQALNSARNKGSINQVEYEFYKVLHDEPDAAPYWEERRQGITQLRHTQGSTRAPKCTRIPDEDRAQSSSSSARRRPDLDFNVVVDDWRRFTLGLLSEVICEDVMESELEYRAMGLDTWRGLYHPSYY